jgi:hypothetical protein
MLTTHDEFVIDAVAHAYNHAPENYVDRESAAVISRLAYDIGGVGAADPRYDMPSDAYISDWSIEDLANVFFRETSTDIAVLHTLPLWRYKDGWCSAEKSASAVERWPHRFRAYAAVDPLGRTRSLSSTARSS